MSHVAISVTENALCIQGNVTFDNVVALRSEGEKLMRSSSAPANVFVIDLSNMSGDDAASLTLLLCFVRCAQKKRCQLLLTQVPLSVRRMGKMFGLTELLSLNH